MSHVCPTPSVFDPNSGAMPQSSLAFKLVDGHLIEMCADCGVVIEASAEDAELYAQAEELILQRVREAEVMT